MHGYTRFGSLMKACFGCFNLKCFSVGMVAYSAKAGLTLSNPTDRLTVVDCYAHQTDGEVKY